MQTSTYLARLMGPLMMAVGAGIFINGAVYRSLADEFLRSRALIYLSGLLTMTAGIAIILAHNVWIQRWPLLITLIGWAMAIGGAVRIVMPQGTEKVGRAMLKSRYGLQIAAVTWLAIGALLIYFGYFARIR